MDQKSLQCLLVQVKEGPFANLWAFPGGLVGAGESLDEAAERELQERTGLKKVYLEQLYTFGKPERDRYKPDPWDRLLVPEGAFRS